MEADAGLIWPVRLSFVQYISSLPDGQAVLSHGARVTPGVGITFPLADADVDASTGNAVVRFSGEVRFTGHHGLLSVTIADPRLQVTNGEGHLSVASRQGHQHLANCSVTFDPRAGGGRWSATEVKLTEWGAGVFGDVYAVGEEMDPFTVTLAS